MGGGGPSHPTLTKPGTWSQKNFFFALRASVWCNNKWPLDPPLVLNSELHAVDSGFQVLGY